MNSHEGGGKDGSQVTVDPHKDIQLAGGGGAQRQAVQHDVLQINGVSPKFKVTG